MSQIDFLFSEIERFKELMPVEFELEVPKKSDRLRYLFCEEYGRRQLNYDMKESSGAYIFSDKERIFYIGKAASNNFASEVWGKFAKRGPEFFEPKWEGLNKQSYVYSLLNKGEFFLTLIKTHQHAASLLEVYLQTFFHYKFSTKDKSKLELPYCNSRIG